MAELNALEITKLWRAPLAERLAHVEALKAAAEAAPLLRRRLETAAATIRGLPVASLPADRRVLEVVPRPGGDVWIVGPESASSDAIGEAAAKVRLEGVPGGCQPDGPTLVQLETVLPHWRELASEVPSL